LLTQISELTNQNQGVHIHFKKNTYSERESKIKSRDKFWVWTQNLILVTISRLPYGRGAVHKLHIL